MRQLLLAPLIALSVAAFADDVVLEDGRRMTMDPEMVVVPNADARVAMFIVQLIDGSKTVESIGVSGCLFNYHPSEPKHCGLRPHQGLAQGSCPSSPD